MEDIKVKNEKTLYEIVRKVVVVSVPSLFVVYNVFFIFTGNFDWDDWDAIGGVAVVAFIVGLLGVPFGMLGGKVGQSWKKTQQAIWIGAIAGTTFGTILLSGSCLFLITVLPQ